MNMTKKINDKQKMASQYEFYELRLKSLKKSVKQKKKKIFRIVIVINSNIFFLFVHIHPFFFQFSVLEFILKSVNQKNFQIFQINFGCFQINFEQLEF